MDLQQGLYNPEISNIARETGGTLSDILTQLQAINSNTDELELKADTVNLNVDTLESLIGTSNTKLSTLIDGINFTDTLVNGIIDADEETVEIATGGLGSCGIQISGTWVGSLEFEGTVDGTNWTASRAVQYSGTLVGGTTVNGLFFAQIGGLLRFRVRASAWTSGTATIYLEATAATNAVTVANSLPLGTNKIGDIGLIGNTAADGSGTDYHALIDTAGHLQTDIVAALPTGTNTIGSVNVVGIGIPAYDYVSRGWVAGTFTETWTFKTGGAGGSTVATITVVYDDVNMSNIVSVTKT